MCIRSCLYTTIARTRSLAKVNRTCRPSLSSLQRSSTLQTLERSSTQSKMSSNRAVPAWGSGRRARAAALTTATVACSSYTSRISSFLRPWSPRTASASACSRASSSEGNGELARLRLPSCARYQKRPAPFPACCPLSDRRHLRRCAAAGLTAGHVRLAHHGASRHVLFSCVRH